MNCFCIVGIIDKDLLSDSFSSDGQEVIKNVESDLNGFQLDPNYSLTKPKKEMETSLGGKKELFFIYVNVKNMTLVQFFYSAAFL